MKKFFGIVAVAVALVACNNAGSSDQRIKDSTDSVRRADSLKNLTPAPVTPPASSDTGMMKMGTDTSASKMMGTDTGMHK